MASRARFRPSKQFEAQMRRDPDMLRARRRFAEQVAASAREFAPVDEGDYRDSIHVEASGDDVRVVADNYKAWWIESGTGEPGPTKKYAPLRRAARRNKLKFRGRRKRR